MLIKPTQHALWFVISLVSLAATHGFGQEWPATFEISGQVVAPRQRAVPGAEVVLVKELRFGQRWEIIDRGQTDDQGKFTLNCPLNAKSGLREVMILVLPTQTTGAALHYYKGPVGFVDKPANYQREYQVGPRQTLQLAIKDDAGKPIPGANIPMISSGGEPFYRGSGKCFLS